MRAKQFLNALGSDQEVARDGQWLRDGLDMFLLRCQKSGRISAADSTNGAMAFAYLRGVLDAILPTIISARMHQAAGGKALKVEPGALIVKNGELSAALQGQQYLRLVLEYLYAHPDQLRKPAYQLVAEALGQRFQASQK